MQAKVILWKNVRDSEVRVERLVVRVPKVRVER